MGRIIFHLFALGVRRASRHAESDPGHKTARFLGELEPVRFGHVLYRVRVWRKPGARRWIGRQKREGEMKKANEFSVMKWRPEEPTNPALRPDPGCSLTPCQVTSPGVKRLSPDRPESVKRG